MHKSPLREAVFGRIDLSGIDRVEDILHPRHKQPHYSDLLRTHRVQHPFRRDTAQKNRAAAREEAAEPMHLRTGMIKRRDAEEHVRMRLRMMLLLGLGGGHKRTVRMEYRFRKARRSGRKIYRRIVVVRYIDRRRDR